MSSELLAIHGTISQRREPNGIKAMSIFQQGFSIYVFFGRAWTSRPSHGRARSRQSSIFDGPSTAFAMRPCKGAARCAVASQRIAIPWLRTTLSLYKRSKVLVHIDVVPGTTKEDSIVTTVAANGLQVYVLVVRPFDAHGAMMHYFHNRQDLSTLSNSANSCSP